MIEAPSLFTLCLDSIKDVILFGDGSISCVHRLPSEILDCLIPRLPALALLKFEDYSPMKGPMEYENELGVGSGSQRKNKRCENIDTAWMTLYKSRFSGLSLTKPDNCSYCHANYDLENNWKELYWNFHIQMCLNAAAEIAGHRHFEGCLGDIKIPDSMLLSMGFKPCGSYSKVDYSKVAYHCQHFGLYARYLTLPHALLRAETSRLLRNSKLEALEIQFIESREEVEGVRRILSQNVDTLASLCFKYCKLSLESLYRICDSLLVYGLPTHKIKHLRVNKCRFLEADSHSISMPAGLVSFSSSTRCLCMADFCDNKLQLNSARVLFNALFDPLSKIAGLDLSGNNISGWLFHFEWELSNYVCLKLGIFTSLRVLKLRRCNLHKDDAHRLIYVLSNMPSLETLDLCGNPIADDGIMALMPYFNMMAKRDTPIVDLNLEKCKLTCNGVISLLQVLSSFKIPLNSLHIGHNNLGSEVGVHLGKYICIGIKELHIHCIGLKSSGFVKAQEQITEGVKLVVINIRGNLGGLGAAKFISKLIVSAPEIVQIDASFNDMPVEAAPMICSSLETAKGKLQHLEVTGNPVGAVPAIAKLEIVLVTDFNQR